MKTRIAVIKNCKGLILGADKNDILEEGHVYEITRNHNEIVIKDLGEYYDSVKNSGEDANMRIEINPTHLYTQAELFEGLNLCCDLTCSNIDNLAKDELDGYLNQIIDTDFNDVEQKELLNKERKRLFEKYGTTNTEIIRGEMWIARKMRNITNK